MARPTNPHSPPIFRCGWGLPDFWQWVAVLYQYVWEHAVTQVRFQSPSFQASKAKRLSNPEQDLDLTALSVCTGPASGAPNKRDISLSHVRMIFERHYGVIHRLRLQPFWFLATGVGLDPLNLDGHSQRGVDLNALLQAQPVEGSRAHSDEFTKFLALIARQICPRALQRYPDKKNPGCIDFTEWAGQASGQVSSVDGPERVKHKTRCPRFMGIRNVRSLEPLAAFPIAGIGAGSIIPLPRVAPEASTLLGEERSDQREAKDIRAGWGATTA